MWAPVGRCWDRVEECPLSNPTLLIYLRSFNILSAFGHRHSISRSCRRKCFNRSRCHCKLGRSKIRSSQRREQGRAQSNRMGSEQSRDHTLLVTVSLSMPPTVNKTNLVFQVWAPTTVIGWRSCEPRTSPIPSSRVASFSRKVQPLQAGLRASLPESPARPESVTNWLGQRSDRGDSVARREHASVVRSTRPRHHIPDATYPPRTSTS